MRRMIFAALLLPVLAAAANPQLTLTKVKCDTDSVTLPYNIIYKWGFIEKVAGHGDVTLVVTDSVVEGTMHGQSIPWGGRLYSVNDTLRTVVKGDGNLLSQRVLYENAWYAKPLVGACDSTVMTNPANYATMLGQGTLSTDASTMEAVSITADMLGFFYIVRKLDFDALQPGDMVKVPIERADGTKQYLDITYNGQGLRDDVPTYDVTFNYTYKGALSAYPVQCTIDAASRIPLIVAANLLIGHVEMAYAAPTD